MSQVSSASRYQYPKKEEAELAPTAGSLRLLGGYTMCPNWIYDSVMVKESPSVIKVVMYFNRNTTGRTAQDGQRIETVQASYGWIARKMEMSLRAVGEAMRTALAKGYLIMVKAPQAATDKTPGEGGCYALNWNWPALPASKAPGEAETPEESRISAHYSNSSNARPQLLATEAEREGQILPEGVEQNLPGGLEQILPACRNKADSKPNKLIELKITADADKLEQQFSSTKVLVSSTGETKSPKLTQKNSGGRKGSSAIGSLISDFTREFGDNPELELPNIGRALNLWQKSGVNETDFIGLVYQARQKTKASGATVRHQRFEASREKQTDLPNRMPYFFGVLGDLIAGLVIEPQKGEGRYTEGQLAELWSKVCLALAERYHNAQLATKAANAQLKVDLAKKQVVVSFGSCPWVLNSLLTSERALLQMAISQEIGKGYELILLDKFVD